ncbi:hypothetical protein QE152_g30252 [Popillia japonica]|uniref:Uncharacterized protein n=1 Tax=Popillia japonica TaxID=7064 RepID=A0AAW1JEZ3_POPJA
MRARTRKNITVHGDRVWVKRRLLGLWTDRRRGLGRLWWGSGVLTEMKRTTPAITRRIAFYSDRRHRTTE